MICCSVRRMLSIARVSFRSYGTLKPKQKPMEIPFQAKLANGVNLMGEVSSPIQFEDSPDGNAWAATIITHQHSPSSPYFSSSIISHFHCFFFSFSFFFLLIFSSLLFSSLRIPVIFVGDLAHTAKYHLKLNDFIHISGQLTTDPPHLNHQQQQQPQSTTTTNNIQLMVRTLNFVQGFPHLTLSNPPFIPQHSSLPTANQNPDSSSTPWTHLVDNPIHWFDFRHSKLNGLVNPKHPDFKRKDGTSSLWLNKAPTWLLPKLQGLQFDVPSAISTKVKDGKGGDSWNDLLQNPANWWDNRLNKRNEKAPDFKHKITGEGLWLNSSPKWVLEKLSPPNPKQNVETARKQIPVS